MTEPITEINAGTQVEMSGVTLAFKGRAILRDFSLILDPGEKVILSGPSGCGKSSLLQSLLGFVEPTQGQLSIQQTPVNAHTAWVLRRSMAYVPQEPDPGHETIRTWLSTPFDFRAHRHRKARLRLMEPLCDELSLSRALLDQTGPELSGGEKQRMALIGALLLDSPLLLLDEPTSALDAEARDRVIALLRRLTRTTILMVSHDPSSAANLTHRVIRLQPPAGGDT